MRPDDPNYEYLLLIADALGDLRDNVVFVGGCTAGLLLTDSAAEGIRVTKDVDAIVEAASLRQYYELESRLLALGFSRDADSDVICRWRHVATGVLFDLMPIDPAILGFSNRWYPEAARTATRERCQSACDRDPLSARNVDPREWLSGFIHVVHRGDAILHVAPCGPTWIKVCGRIRRLGGS